MRMMAFRIEEHAAERTELEVCVADKTNRLLDRFVDSVTFRELTSGSQGGAKNVCR